MTSTDSLTNPINCKETYEVKTIILVKRQRFSVLFMREMLGFHFRRQLYSSEASEEKKNAVFDRFLQNIALNSLLCKLLPNILNVDFH